MIRSVRFEPEGPESRSSRATLRNPRIENRMRIPPLVEVNIRIEDLSRDIRLRRVNLKDKNASFLIGWYDDVTAPSLIMSPESIDRFVVGRIESLRKEMAKCRAATRQDYRAKIEVMKNNLGLVRDEHGNWSKNPTEITHTLKIPSKFGVTTDHAIITIGTDGLTVTPLTEQEGWVKMITPKSYNFTFDVKPGESAMVKFGFKW